MDRLRPHSYVPRKKTAQPVPSPESSTPEEAQSSAQTEAFPIVGIGASAGGLQALRALFGAVRPDTGMGFVVVQHLSPEHASSLAEILSRTTAMPVCEVGDEPVVEPNRIYVIPPGRDMIIERGKLRLLPQDRATRHRGIDQFFRSLAEDCGHLAIGIVLSGSASDGTVGIEEIKAAGGIAFAQDASAQHGSMPQSAAESGCVDFVLPPEKIAAELARIAEHPYVAGETEEEEPERQGPGHARIAQHVRKATGVDFTHYKAITLHRRISRRMLLHRLDTMREYEDFLRRTPGEVEALYADVLISVTSFFRNPDAFEVLAKKVFPAQLAGRSPHDTVRVWSLGCSTGEEAYSLAMVFAEAAEAAGSSAQLQLFATDLSAAGIAKARAGLYPRSIAVDVSPERLQRFFVEEEGGYRIVKDLRERCVFSRHNVVGDPPFSRLDFISCRNLLIYLEPVLQQQILPLIHYALKPGGCLWLGSSETVGTSRALFDCEDARHKIFTRKPGPPTPRLSPAGARPRIPGGFSQAPPPARETSPTDLHRDAERLLLSRFAPPGVVVTAALEITQFRGETGAFLAPAAGAASHNLLKMLREGLLVGVRAAIKRAGEEGRAVREEGLHVKSNGGFRDLAVEVIPIKSGVGRESGFVVLFDEGARPPAPPSTDSAQPSATRNDPDEVARLGAELAATRDYLQSVIEQQEAANEELQSANEEAQSANEELQSVNEELETSKEEIQSASEELATVNDELNNRNLELARLNNDLTNVLASSRLPMLILGRDLRIRRFTPAAEQTLGLAAGDIGRPLDETKLSVVIAGLAPLLREVLDNFAPRERDMQDARGRWFSLRARPYQTHDNKIDGVVLTLVDIDELHRARAFANDLLAHAPVPVLVLDARLRVKAASGAFYTTFKVTHEATEGRLVYELGNRQWDIRTLRRLLEEVLPQGGVVEDFEVRHDFEIIGKRVMLLNARRLEQTESAEPLMVLSIEDITERAGAIKAAARLAAIVESSEDAIISKNLDGVIMTWNRGAQRLFGYTAEEVIGKPVTIFIPAERITEEADILGHIRRGEPVEHFETVRRRKDGSLVDVSLTVSPIVDSAGRIVGASKIARDITERTQAEAALRENERRFREMIDALPVAIYTTDAEGRLTHFNPACVELSGRQPQLETDHWCVSWKLFHPDGTPMPHGECPMAVALREGRAVRGVEAIAERPDGSRFWFMPYPTPLFDAEGRIVGGINMLMDITDRREMEATLVGRAEDLARADRSKDEFLAMLAHELRNPLAPLRNAAEILKLPGASDEDCAQAQRILGRSIENMSRMIDDLLDVSRITEGKISLRRAPVSLEAVMTAAASLAHSDCTARGQVLTVSTPAEPIFLNADATRLEQVFNNLLGNACKYSGDKSHICFSAKRAPGDGPPEVIISVKDDGIGIAPELLPRVFDLFVQATRSLERAHGGLGIGLTLVQRLVQLHGGTVEARSDGLGHGAEFIVRLPVLHEAPLPPAPSPAPAQEIPRRILIVDDHTDSARSLETLLRRRGHETRAAFTGPDAMTAAVEFRPEVVLLDIGLPGMDGFEVARKIRTIPDLASVFLMAMSGYGRDEDRAEAKAAGFDEYLIKPIELEALRDLLRKRTPKASRHA